jgi:hypothetical protein
MFSKDALNWFEKNEHTILKSPMVLIENVSPRIEFYPPTRRKCIEFSPEEEINSNSPSHLFNSPVFMRKIEF